MLYITHDIVQTLLIPATLPVVENAELRFALRSTVNLDRSCRFVAGTGDYNQDFNADFLVFVQRVLTNDGRYIKAEIEFNELPQDGEYEYALVSNGTIVSAGLAQIGEYNNETTQYEREIEYRQYEG